MQSYVLVDHAGSVNSTLNLQYFIGLSLVQRWLVSKRLLSGMSPPACILVQCMWEVHSAPFLEHGV